jgi:septum site-determining protein MinD
MKIISVCSGKGGVGKSTIVANLGATYSQRGLDVLLIDMNIGLRNLDIHLGLENKVIYDIYDVLENRVSLSKAILIDKRFSSLYFLPTVQGRRHASLDQAALESLLYSLKRQFDIILIDGPAGIGESFFKSISCSDLALIVANPDYVSLRDADMVNNLLKNEGVKDRVYVINKVDENALGIKSLPSTHKIISTMNIDLVGVIQQDFDIFLANSEGHPEVINTNSYIYRNFLKISDRLLWYG